MKKETPWRSLEELADSPEFREMLRNEFPAGAAWLDEVESGETSLRRRRFIQLMGASFGLAGLTSCGRQKPEKILPYVTQPEDTLPGVPSFYASALSFQGYGRGILVESNMGRPTKIEGNPDHPASLGATDPPGQAAVLDLYDPDRARVVKKNGSISTWEEFENEFSARIRAHDKEKGAGFAILIEPTTSPSLQKALAETLKKMPQARVFQHSPLPLEKRDGGGAPPLTSPENFDAPKQGARASRLGIKSSPFALPENFDASKPDVIVSIGIDFLASHPDSLRMTREFSKRRRAGGKLNRLYVIESTPTITGMMADHRLAVKPSRLEILRGVLAGQNAELSERESAFLEKIRGEKNPTILSAESVENSSWMSNFADLSALNEAIQKGEVDTLLILGANPVYTCPGDLPFEKNLKKVAYIARLGSHDDETSAHCHWHLPEAHFLETWGDIRSFDGTLTIRQPLIEPLYEGRSALEVLVSGKTVLEVVRETWKGLFGGEDFETFWKTSLHDGVAEASGLARVEGIPFFGDDGGEKREEAMDETSMPLGAEDGTSEPLEAMDETSKLLGIELQILADPVLGFGEQANNGWLQELPRPFTKLVWDNAALVAPAFATRHGLENGDVVILQKGASREVEAPVWILPGQPDDTVTVHLGYGRKKGGTLADGVGFDAYPLLGFSGELKLTKTAKKHDLVTTQAHSLMEGRELIWQLTAEDVAKNEFSHRPPAVPNVTLYDDENNGRYAWAMSIDLSTCIGCSACVTACQAENNIPVVGKDEVRRGREMHWIRLDRYFMGEADAPKIVNQPVTCQHCEKAPCEVVCPVEATVHTSDGLNAMVYNRCVGTRYCSNNCPYKVRRFNFFDYRNPMKIADPRALQANPNVTVRGRGVMEKCTYCVQRIQRAVINADREHRRVREGEIVTACQQACPAEAIIFGDLKTKESKVRALRSEPSAYALLGELNTRPRTNYLAKITNPNA